jgi:hypothetical protein
LEKILIINTPAYINNNVPFHGFPVSVEDKIVGFGGSNIYKIKDEADTFLNLIKSLLIQNPNFIFFFANVGDTDYVNNFIKSNGLESRLIALGNRDDICAIYKKIDIFFNTYPYAGANMLSYAFQNKVPVVALNNKEFTHSRLDLIFDIEVKSDYLIEDKTDYINYANRLINSAEYRKQVSDEFELELDKRISFDEGLKAVLNDDESRLIPVTLEKIPIGNNSDLEFHLNKNQFQSQAYFNLKSSILRDCFFSALRSDWKNRDYWKYSFSVSLKSMMKKYFPFLKNLKSSGNG